MTRFLLRGLLLCAALFAWSGAAWGVTYHKVGDQTCESLTNTIKGTSCWARLVLPDATGTCDSIGFCIKNTVAATWARSALYAWVIGGSSGPTFVDSAANTGTATITANGNDTTYSFPLLLGATVDNRSNGYGVGIICKGTGTSAPLAKLTTTPGSAADSFNFSSGQPVNGNAWPSPLTGFTSPSQNWMMSAYLVYHTPDVAGGKKRRMGAIGSVMKKAIIYADGHQETITLGPYTPPERE